MAKDKAKKKAPKRKRAKIIKVNKARHMIITPVVRLSFPNLFTAKAFQDNPREAKTFYCDLIADNEDVWKEPYKGKKTQTVSLKKAIRNCMVDQWGEDKADWPEVEHPAIRDGDDKQNDDGETLEGYEGKSYISPRSGEDYPPKIVLVKGGGLADEKDVYGGCYVRAQILCRPYDTGTKAGVSLRLLSVMKVADGEKFGVGTDLFDTDDFDADEEEEEADWGAEDDEDEDDDI